MKDVTKEDNVRILKMANCQTVSGKSTLTYHIGCTEEGETQLRIHANTAAGFVNPEWVSFPRIDEALSAAGSHFTSLVLRPLFRGKSQNNTAFLLAVLLQEGLVARAEDKKRSYQRLDTAGFISEINALMVLNADDKPMKSAKQLSGKKAKSDETLNEGVAFAGSAKQSSH